MGLITKEVDVKWSNKTKQWFIDKGYNFTKTGDIFKAKVEDLSTGSHSKVKYVCDACKKEKEIAYKDFLTHLKPNETKYHCQKCASKLFGVAKTKQMRLEKSISFQQWCYNNFSLEKSNEIMQRWDYEKNDFNPNEVCFKSSKLYWFKCPNKHNHKSELKRISDFTGGHNKTLNCIQCSSISTTNPDLAKYLVNEEDAYKYSLMSSKKIQMKCPLCGYEKQMGIGTLYIYGFGCNKCGNGISYPERFVIAFLNQLNIEFISQYSKRNALWCNRYRYDFCLPKYNIIIEVHGSFHFDGWGRNKDDLAFQKENDKAKKKLALQNGIVRYIEIDAYKSDANYIKSSILKSDLVSLFNLNSIDWNKCENDSLLNLVKQSCNFYNSGLSVTQISKKLTISPITIRRYLKRGYNIGWTNYQPNPNLGIPKQIICLNTGEVFDSVLKASLKLNIERHKISNCVKGKTQYYDKSTNKVIEFMYYSDYKQLKIS